MKADLIIDPDADTADEIMELAHVSGADEVYPHVATATSSCIGAVIAEGSPLAGSTLGEIGADRTSPNWRFLFGALTRATARP